jgi:peptide deformylase
MAIHPILKMGDPRLLRLAQPVPRFDTPELHALVRDMLAHLRPLLLAPPQRKAA